MGMAFTDALIDHVDAVLIARRLTGERPLITPQRIRL